MIRHNPVGSNTMKAMVANLKTRGSPIKKLAQAKFIRVKAMDLRDQIVQLWITRNVYQYQRFIQNFQNISQHSTGND